MKKLLTKLLIVAVAATGFWACSPEKMAQNELVKWIAAYTPEKIDANSIVRIEATDSLLARMDTLRSLDKVFKFSPAVAGKAVYSNGGRFVDFVPQKGALKQGKNYRCCVNMAALTGIDSLKNFVFHFGVVRCEVHFSDVELTIDPENVEQIVVNGVLNFSCVPSDFFDPNSLLVCNEKGAKTQITPTENALQWAFRISEIKRKKQDFRLNIKFDPKTEISNETATVVVPSLETFTLISAKRVEATQPYINLEFSELLDCSQELDGLISIDSLENVRFERKGTNVKVFYPKNGLTTLFLRVSELLRASDGKNLAAETVVQIEQNVLKPDIEIPISGTILPDNQNLTLPFRAVNLAAVDVEVVKIYSDNVLTFLQENDLDGTWRLRRVGRLIYKKTVRLDNDKSLDLHQWQNFSVNLENLFRQERGAIYNIRLSFSDEYSLYNRAKVADFEPKNGIKSSDKAEWDQAYPYIWRDGDACEYNLAASNIGLIVKKADTEQVWCTVSDILTAAPMAGIRVVAYNFQMREIGTATTNEQGFADFKTSGSPFVITASDGVSTTFLKIKGRAALSTSRFDVSGKKNASGVKGFVYGERGVWRPGDDIFLTLILEDKKKQIPENHPITMELYTPTDQLYDRKTIAKNVGGIYIFETKTAEDAPTGSWNARFKVGGQTFHHTVRIETIKPNRLKINIKSPEILHAASENPLQIEARWLTGVTAGGLATKMEMSLYKNPQPFKQFSGYIFDNPLCGISAETHEIFADTLDLQGKIAQKIVLPDTKESPGMLRANLVARVAEKGGDESLTSRSVLFSPYSAYVGIKLGEREFETDCDLRFPVVVVDENGKKGDFCDLEYKIYRLNWAWWNENSAEKLSRYIQGTSAEIVANGTLKTADGEAEIPFRLDFPSWGKFLVFVRDKKGGHATGAQIFIDWPDWRGHSGKSDPSAATMLSFALDKKNYEVGEEATVFLPKSAGGKVLLSVENGSRVVSRRWVTLSANKETAFKLPIGNELAPNFYVFATLLQPYKQTANDLPIRLYGVQAAEVVDRKTILKPEISVPNEILPQQEFSVKISEKNNHPMSYTLAIVDEGLLDITAYQTPQPWRAMNQREALGVKTWDMYSDVIAAYAGKFTSILSIGGDEALRKSAGKEKRFHPVVKFLGPFTLNSGSKTHKITLPMYVGSVRVMVVAARNGCYGSADKTVAVRSPLMMLSSLPHSLACGDKIKVPITVFSTKKSVKNAAISIKTEGPVSVVGTDEKKVNFAENSEQMVEFELLCDPKKSGKAKIFLSAKSAEQTVSETVFIDVKNRQPLLTNCETKSLSGGKKVAFEWQKSCDEVRLEIATMPAINFGEAFSFVENYSHFCSEQLASRAMFMLYARRFLGENEQKRAEELLPKILQLLLSRQLPNGGFAYWDGFCDAHEWATSMAGEAMTEAKKQGFVVDEKAFNRWKEYQKKAARNYRHTVANAADLVQAYRLYTLALAGETPLAAMNRLRESKNVSHQALTRLAATYAVLGKNEVAEKLLEKAENCPKIAGNYATFYSPLRDLAMETEALALVGNEEKSLKMAQKMAEKFSANRCTTQEVAFVSVAMNRLADVANVGKNEILVNEKNQKPLIFKDLRATKTVSLRENSGSVAVENKSEKAIAVSLLTKRTPAADEQILAVENGVKINVLYTDLHGKPISVENLPQGTEFLAKIAVKKAATASESMALTFAIPSGWEIWNERLINGTENSDVQHLDIRDDQISWYFGLKSGEKRTFSVRLRAALCGKFVLPAAVCEDMYDAECRAVVPNRMVEVTASNPS